MIPMITTKDENRDQEQKPGFRVKVTAVFREECL
jgi:hypothetical protein